MTEETNGSVFTWQLCLSECIGTALLVAGGLSLVILTNASESPIARMLPNEGLRRALTGFLFGGWAGLIVVSPVGKISGAHINPAVTLGFWLMGKIRPGVAIGYIVAQLIGAALGALPLLAWGAMGKRIAYGATLPGAGFTTQAVLMGEAVTTFALIVVLCLFLGFRHLRPFLPPSIPVLYMVMVYLEGPLSGTSTNPARTFGPAIISGQWRGAWIYWVGPLMGTLAGTLACSWLAKSITSAKLYDFDSDRDLLLRRS